MNRTEAIRAMLDGKKLKSKDWGVDHYIYFDGDDFKHRSFVGVRNYYLTEINRPEDLEIYEDNEIKVGDWVNVKHFKDEFNPVKVAHIHRENLIFRASESNIKFKIDETYTGISIHKDNCTKVPAPKEEFKAGDEVWIKGVIAEYRDNGFVVRSYNKEGRHIDTNYIAKEALFKRTEANE